VRCQSSTKWCAQVRVATRRATWVDGDQRWATVCVLSAFRSFVAVLFPVLGRTSPSESAAGRACSFGLLICGALILDPPASYRGRSTRGEFVCPFFMNLSTAP
jgi:hypothetical protein